MKTSLLIFLSLLTFCSSQNKTDNTLNFEGQIVYNVNYPNHRITDNNQVASVINVFYKNGYIRKEQKTNKGVVLNYSIYHPVSNMYLSFTKGSDTVYYYYPGPEEASFHSIPFSESESSNENILGYSCKKISISSPDNEYVYYVSDQLKVDTTGIHGAAQNVIFLNYVVLKYSYSKPAMKEVTATKINHTTIKQEVFKLDTAGKVLVELK